MRDKLKELIRRLTEKNQSDKIIWKKTSTETEFKATIGNSTITVNNFDDQDGENYTFTIYNKNGEKIEDILLMDSMGDNNIILLKELYSSVIETYYQVDKTIDDILDDLEN
ncbi:hypothetical protein FHS04_002077 [Mesoflavibacter sabulilitoris]|uniref:Uncharacterized protein n=1 Tax=Mesoflavibacter zeaxanthinifaciens subsp. sabulilitoris TaxID=1520893 RepID=A0A2T1NM24_9FLAO|nr:hypothetical protein [Mesoflavibacter zeaxanthinifaciens]MBB3124554.1 hypothetical protein [Mesoflavibacter zeaxanthinifaciens subsp. sabulilitoris]PSG93921.1 hypothetical protein C7H61_01740 [Mesoflavibacter zeaxanthinifaciens subsp. sabulilitoris]